MGACLSAVKKYNPEDLMVDPEKYNKELDKFKKHMREKQKLVRQVQKVNSFTQSDEVKHMVEQGQSALNYAKSASINVVRL